MKKSDPIFYCDTCQYSILHNLYKTEISSTSLRRYIIPYLATMVLFFIIPFLIAICTSTPLFESTSDVEIGLFNDWASIIMYSITLPLFVVFLLDERILIPDSIALVLKNKALKLRKDDIKRISSKWENIYKYLNIIAQILATLIAIGVSCVNYFLSLNPKNVGWQAAKGQITASGLIWIFWQMPIFYWIATVYLVRGITTVYFLRDIVKNSIIRIFPYHTDRASGLGSIGKIILRNQYLLCICGVNIVFMGIVCFTSADFTDRKGDIYLFYTVVIIYILACPLVVLLPLLPFHKKLFEAKLDEQNKLTKKIRKNYNNLIKNIRKKENFEEDGNLLEYHKLLKRDIDKVPVWPIDFQTTQKVVSAYILPILLSIPFKSSYIGVLLNIIKRAI